MAQKRFHTFQRPVDSFAENERMLGILRAGRQIGFDTFNQTGPLAGDLLHTTTGVEKTDVALVVSDPQGALLTPQGVMIYEDAAISISGFSSNAGNNARIDLIICEHEYLASVGGQAATYSIIEGTPASGSLDIPTIPALTNPEKQIIVGQMFIPGGDANLNNAIYTAGVPTTVGGLGQALLDQIQQYTKTQSLSKGTDTEVDSDNLIKVEDDGNSFECTLNDLDAKFMADKPEGTRISLILKTGSETTTDFKNFASSPPVGYIPFLLGANIIFSSGTILSFERVSFPFDGWGLVSANANTYDIIVNANDIAQNASDITDILDGTTPFTGAIIFQAGINNGGTILKEKVIDIGDWNMDTTNGITVNHGLGAGFKKIKRIDVIIRNDVDAKYYNINHTFSNSDSTVQGSVGEINSTNISLVRTDGGIFDSADFDSTSFNRGWVYITYEA